MENLLPESLPPELRKWNWGAFGCSFIWAAAMKRWGWFGLTIIILAATFIIPMGAIFCLPWYWISIIYLSTNGNRLAWESRNWDSIEQFIRTQRVWRIWGKIIFAIYIILAIIWIALFALSVMFHD